MKEDFDIKVLELNWLKGLKETQDCCLHYSEFDSNDKPLPLRYVQWIKF